MERRIKIIIGILSLLLGAFSQLEAQDNTVSIKFSEPKVVFEANGDKYVDFDISLKKLGLFTDTYGDECKYSILRTLDLMFDVDKTAFSDIPTGYHGTNPGPFDFNFIPTKPLNTYYERYNVGVILGQVVHAIITCNVPVSEHRKDLELPGDGYYPWGTVHWKLLPSATHFTIAVREHDKEGGINSCGAMNYNEIWVNLIFENPVLSGDVPDDPLNGVPKPVIPDDQSNLAWLDYVCSPEKTVEYTVTRPAGVDSCIWYLSSDKAGKNKVQEDVADFVVTDKGEKAQITWKNSETKNTYWLQVYSKKGKNESDPVQKEITVEGFPEIQLAEKYECKQTTVTWVNPTDITAKLYQTDYTSFHDSPFVVASSDKATFHLVSYRTADATCKDTVDYTPAFLDPQITWLTEPQATVGRGDLIEAMVNTDMGLPAAYTPKKTEYIWTKPAGIGTDVAYYTCKAESLSYSFEVKVSVDGCESNTLTAKTQVQGGGILPNAISESGKDIVCQGGGVLLSSNPTGAKEPFTYKWYVEGQPDVTVSTEQSVWVTPDADTRYVLEITDALGLKGRDTVSVTYKAGETPATVDAGADQGIVEGTYTLLMGEVSKPGSSDVYTWNWRPEDMLAVPGKTQLVRTKELTATQKYAVFVVDANGCMSKPDSMTVTVYPQLVDGGDQLPPDDKDEHFEMNVIPKEAVLCKNNSVQLAIESKGINLEGATYQWSPTEGLDDPKSPTPVLSVIDGVSSGDYTVTVKKQNFTIVRQMKLTVNDKEEAPVLQLAEHRMSCVGDIVEVSPKTADQTPDEYIWTVNGQQIAETGNSYTLNATGEQHIRVYAKMTGATCASDTIHLDKTIGQTVTFEGLTDELLTCRAEGELSFTSKQPDEGKFVWLKPDLKTAISSTDTKVTVQESGVYALVGGEGECADTTKIKVTLNNDLKVEGLNSLIASCTDVAQLAFTSTTAASYVWLNTDKEAIDGSENQNPYEVTDAGDYYLAMEAGDCKDTVHVTVELSTQPFVTVDKQQTSCEPELAINGTATVGTLYWSEHEDGSDPVTDKVTGAKDETKVYYVYAAVGDCKSDITRVTVAFGAAPLVTALDTITSCETELTLQASTTAGELKWLDEKQAPLTKTTVKGLKSTDYYVYAEDGACVSEKKKVVAKFNSKPAVIFDPVQTTCGTEYALAAQATEGELHWLAADKQPLTTAEVQGDAGKTYDYYVYAENTKVSGCRSKEEKVQVVFGSAPQLQVSSPQTACAENGKKEVTLELKAKTTGGDLVWRNDKKEILGTPWQTAAANTTAIYYVQAEDQGCVSEEKKVEARFGSAPVITVEPLQTSCGEQHELLAETSAGELTWLSSNGNTQLTSPTVTPTMGDTYYVYASDKTCMSDKIEVKVAFNSRPLVEAVSPQTSCGTLVDLKAKASGGKLIWKNADGEKLALTQVTGVAGETAIYYVHAEDATCQSAPQAVEVRFGESPEVIVESEQTACELSHTLEALATAGELVWMDDQKKVLTSTVVIGEKGKSRDFYVYAKDGDCESAEQKVTVHFGIDPVVKTLALQTTCETEIQLEASSSSGTLEWSDADGDVLNTNLVSGKSGDMAYYFVTAVDGSCRSTAERVEVRFGSKPEVLAEEVQTACGKEYTLEAQATNGVLTWFAASDETTPINPKVTAGGVYYVQATDGKCVSDKQKITVKLETSPVLQLQSPQTTCGEEIVLEATASGGKVVWTDEKGNNLAVAKVKAADGKKSAVYYAQAVDGQCHSIKQEVNVQFGQKPRIRVEDFQTGCEGTVDLTAEASGGDVYWLQSDGKTPLTSTLVDGSLGTAYYVYAKDGTCVSDTVAVNIGLHIAPVVSVVSPQTTCDQDLQLEASASAGELVWTDAKGQELIPPFVSKGTDAQAVYRVKAVDGTCEGDVREVLVKFGSKPEVLVETVQTSCDTLLELQGKVSAGTLMWEDENHHPLDNPSVHGKGSKVYYAYAHAGSGCESERVKVTVHFGTTPLVQVENRQTACGTSIDLKGEASGGKLIWTNSTGQVLNNTHRTMGKETNEIYYVYAQDGSCKSSKEAVEVIYNQDPELLVDKLQTSCGTSHELKATTSGGMIFWVDKNLEAVPTVVTGNKGTTDTYYVYAQDGTCKTEEIPVQVTFGKDPELKVDFNQYSCEPAYHLEATATGGTIIWKNEKHEVLKSEQVDLTAGQPNIFYVTVQDESCTPAVNLPEEKVTVTLSGKPELALSEVHCVGEELIAENRQGTDKVNYHWIINDQPLADESGNTHIFTAAGQYEVKVVGEAAGGCISDTVKAHIEIAEPLKLNWQKAPEKTIAAGLNLDGCVEVVGGKTDDVKSWHWLSPLSPAPSGACFNFPALDQDYLFKVYAEDSHGCVSDTLTHLTTVTGLEALDLKLTSESGEQICAGGSALLQAEVTGGQPPYLYEWYEKDGLSPVRSVKTAAPVDVLPVDLEGDATYIVKVKDSKAQPAVAKAELKLTLKTVTGKLPLADAGPDMTIKKGLHAVLKGGNNQVAAWSWLPVDKLAAVAEAKKQYPMTADLSESQIYTLYVKDQQGCISKPDTAIVYVLPLDGTEGGDLPKPPAQDGLYVEISPELDTLCLGNERWICVKDMDKSLSGKQTYEWVNTDGLTFNTRKDSALFRPVKAGDYSFVVTVTDGAKRVSLRSDIRVNDVQVSQFALKSSASCQYDTVKLVYDAGSAVATSVEWRVDGIAVEAAGDYYILDKAGKYTVDAVALNNGCRSAGKEIEVEVQPVPEITDLVITDSCARAVVEVQAVGADSYDWTTKTLTGKVDPADATRYLVEGVGAFQVSVKAVHGQCSAEKQAEGVIYSRPSLGKWITEPMDVEKNAKVVAAVAVQHGTGTPDYRYHWMQPEAKEEDTGSYTLDQAVLANYGFQVYATDAKGCASDTLTKAITVNGGEVKVKIHSVYGDEICQNGAGMLVAEAQGLTGNCLFQWLKSGEAQKVRLQLQSGNRDTLWVKAADVAEYEVSVTDKSGKHGITVGKISSLTVGNHTAPQLTTEPVLTIQPGGTTILPVKVVDGTPDYNWHWSPADRLMNPADSTKQYPQTMALQTETTYRVFVTDKNSCVSVPASTRVAIDQTNGICVKVQPETAELCRNNEVKLEAVVSCGKPTGWSLLYDWTAEGDGLEAKVTDKDTILYKAVKEGEYTALVTVSNPAPGATYKAVAAARISIAGNDAPVLALSGRSDCLYDTLKVTNTGAEAANYVWTINGVKSKEKGESYVLDNKDIREVEVYAESVDGCHSDVITRKVKLGVIPEVEIVGGAFVSYADAVNVLKLKQTDGLTNADYSFEWKSEPDGKFEGVSNQMTAITKPTKEDVKYTAVVTSKENSVCQAADTAWGYIIPNRADVGIDKDANTGNILLSWDKKQLAMADSVRIMNVKWDGYGVQSAYHPEKMVAADAEKYSVDISKDTLEFFYINASRFISEMGKSYYSLASDTVGYMRQWLYANAKGNYQNNYIAYPFDMSEKGIKNKTDLIKFLGKNSDDLYAIYTLAHYEPRKNKWDILSMFEDGTSSGEDLELQPKEIYKVILRKDETVDLLLFGKLPPLFTYNLNKDYTYNYIITPLSFGYKTNRNAVGDVINGIYSVASFNFATQKWGLSTKLSDGTWNGTGGDFGFTVFRPLRIVVKTSTDWKY